MNLPDRIFVLLISFIYLMLLWLKFVESYLNIYWSLIPMAILAFLILRKEVRYLFEKFRETATGKSKDAY